MSHIQITNNCRFLLNRKKLIFYYYKTNRFLKVRIYIIKSRKRNFFRLIFYIIYNNIELNGMFLIISEGELFIK